MPAKDDRFFGHKLFSVADGNIELTATTITEKALPFEDEKHFLDRLLAKYDGHDGKIEIVYKRGQPEYAIVSLS